MLSSMTATDLAPSGCMGPGLARLDSNTSWQGEALMLRDEALAEGSQACRGAAADAGRGRGRYG